MKHTPATLRVLKENVTGLSPQAQAVLLAGYILAQACRSGSCSISELRGVFGLSEAAFEPILAELYDAQVAFRFDGDEMDVNISHDLLQYAVGLSGRPRAKEWEALKRELFARWFPHTTPYCMYCHADDVPLTLDHALPVVRGGSNHPANFVAACYACNSSKRDKTYQEFMAWRAERGL